MINCKIELKLKWAKYCGFSAAINESINDNDNGNNIDFTIKGTKLYVPVVTLSAKEKQKSSKFLSNGFETSVYWNEYKTKWENKNTTTNEQMNKYNKRI